MRWVVFDIETDGLLDDLTKLHVVSAQGYDMDKPMSFSGGREAVEFIRGYDLAVAHYGSMFDRPALEKLRVYLGDTVLCDTVFLSWYLKPNRKTHRLEDYGTEYGIEKPKVDDWDNLSFEEYKHRCEEDVKINVRLWLDLLVVLKRMYKTDKELLGFIKYLTFKGKCMALQEEAKWAIDVPAVEALHDTLKSIVDEKTEALSKVMPRNRTVEEKTIPPKLEKADGSPTVAALKWYDLCRNAGMPKTCVKLNVVTKDEPGNPKSSPQIKSWLTKLGWKPQTFKWTRNKTTGETKGIPQVRNDGELCESVKRLAEVDDSILILDGLTVATHRLSVVSKFLSSQRDGFVVAGSHGITNTMRFRHKDPCLNLPGVDKPYGTEVRSLLVAPEGYLLCGADMVSLEDTTKRHYMMPHDPDYVADMEKPGFDPHLDLAYHHGVITQEDIALHNNNQVSLKALRKAYKTTNYSATYNIKPLGLSRAADISVEDAKALLDGFWERNWSLLEIAKETRKSSFGGMNWLYNPVSKFWVELRNEKDTFSSLNQSTGVYVFDSWLYNCIERFGLIPVGQFHDEVIWLVKDGDQAKTETYMLEAIRDVNEELNLNVEIKIDYSFGKTYAEIH